MECAEFSRDGRLVATATKYSKEMSVWRVADGTLLWSATADQEVERIAFSPDGTLLAAGGEDDLLRLFHPGDGKLVLTLRHSSSIDSLRWSPNGTVLRERYELMERIIGALRGRGTTVLFVEHDMEVVERFAGRVLAFYEGTIIADGPPASVLATPEVRELIAGHA